MIVDLYAGPGGWSEGLRTLGLVDIGWEIDEAACATRAAAGHQTIRADVTTWPLDRLVGRVDGIIASPPCQAFSMAGKGTGRRVLDELVDAVARGDWGWSHDDDRVRHVLEVGRWVETIRPRWIACEQVPPVLPVWEAYADRWRHRFGWSVWCGVLNAADWGVPQTRRRAFLIARTDGAPATPPEPTHCEGGALTMFGELAPWVTMAEALGWSDDVTVEQRRGAGMAERHGDRPKRPAASPAPSITAGANRRLVLDRRQQNPDGTPVPPVDCDTEPSPTLDSQVGGKWVLRYRSDSRKWVEEYGERPDRDYDEPVPTITRQAYRWVFREIQEHGTVRTLDQPAMTISASADNGNYRFELWPTSSPATTVTGDPRIAARGHHGPGSQGRNAVTVEQVMTGDYDGKSPIRLSPRDALILQGFPPDYPVQGTRTKQFEQIGNAVPPPLAAAVVAAVTRPAARKEMV